MAAIAGRGILRRVLPSSWEEPDRSASFRPSWHLLLRHCRGAPCRCAAHAGHVPAAVFFVMIPVCEREEVALAFPPRFPSIPHI